MSNFEGVTFAFSHKNKVWRTRYSFTPTTYANIDNVFISCNGKHPTAGNGEGLDSNVFWEHDANAVHNKFYGFQYDMSVAFVSNYNPSSVKMFKSLSAESNSLQWQGFVTTNNNPSGSSQLELQRATLGTFKRKEGTSYTDIPTSSINSTAHISLAFSALSGLGFNLPPGEFFDVGLTPDNRDLQWDVDIDIQYGQIQAGSNCYIIVRSEQGLAYIKGGALFPIGEYTPNVDQGYLYVESFNAIDQTVRLRMKVPEQDLTQYPFPAWNDLSDCYIQAPASTNGDYMRGHYMNVYLSNPSTAPVECLAFNVNYEPTKLDHSLGQNA